MIWYGIIPSKTCFLKKLVGLEVATKRSTISGGQSDKQGKDGASPSDNEVKEGGKLRMLQKQKSKKICQLLLFSHHYYHPSSIKVQVTMLTKALELRK